MIAVVHPSGNANVREVLSSLENEEILAAYLTTIGFSSTSPWMKCCPDYLHRELSRRSYDLRPERILTHPLREIGRLLLSAYTHQSGIGRIDGTSFNNVTGSIHKPLDLEEDQISGGITTAEMCLGLQYKKPLSHQNITFRLGYEMNYVLNQTRLINWFGGVKESFAENSLGMSLQGVTLELRLDF